MVYPKSPQKNPSLENQAVMWTFSAMWVKEKWKVFETLWNRTKMYKDYYEAVDQKQFLPFLNMLK